jgi:hypothetical protein
MVTFCCSFSWQLRATHAQLYPCDQQCLLGADHLSLGIDAWYMRWFKHGFLMFYFVVKPLFLQKTDLEAVLEFFRDLETCGESM